MLTPISRYTVDTNRLSGKLDYELRVTFTEVSAYAPSVLAATDMYKRHLNLITDYIETNKSTRVAEVKTMQQTVLRQKGNAYTTLESTKQFIRRNRPRTLTMEEALAQVREESL